MFPPFLFPRTEGALGVYGTGILVCVCCGFGAGEKKRIIRGIFSCASHFHLGGASGFFIS